MSNLPKEIPAIKAYEGSPLQIRLDMYTGFIDPGVTFEVYFNKVKKYEITGVYNAGLNRITADFTAEQIKEMPLIADVRVRFGADKYPLRVKIKPSSEGSSDGVVGYTIGLSGDSYTVIEILGLSLVEEQVGIATEKANQTAADALQTAADRIQTGQDAATATTKATEAAGSAAAAANSETGAVNAQQGAEAAQAIALAATQDPLPETFAAMKAVLVQGVARQYTVQHDEFQGADEVPYYFNGQRLFAWGVPIDDEEQPIFN